MALAARPPETDGRGGPRHQNLSPTIYTGVGGGARSEGRRIANGPRQFKRHAVALRSHPPANGGRRGALAAESHRPPGTFLIC
ncbi:hypothetical protein EVAR_21579_1 [Eumeta japonica]|uniref:Uncharacterized protein n=1 Tax=Eumeta variegata TaxID=151549 RepID=A0A4C1UXB8_EUMVA|nr:hypothetical protein EVAR_21579_1 [Eumeta japonica]